MDPNKKVVAVGLSGGVDSSVSALMLQQMGYEVFGLFMKNWEEDDNNGACQATKDLEDVIQVCNILKIPYYTVNFSKKYYDDVFQNLLDGLKNGTTPNPDILCNKEVKFKHFLQKAQSLGADYLATGHYSQLSQEKGFINLLKGKDLNKDQTYFLYTLQQHQLEKVKFPIGHLLKSEVRALARDYHLPNHEKKDSTGICFIGKRNFKDFISEYIPMQEGPIVDISGKTLGVHQGVFYYTIGQRKGLGIGGEGDAWFVVDKDVKTNSLIVSQGHDHPLLFSKGLIADSLSWTVAPPKTFPFVCECKIRYRQEDQPCLIESLENGLLKVKFPTPLRAVTPSQSIVFYKDSICLGGGIIKSKIN